MAVMAREAWTDKRLDDLNRRVESVDRRMEAGFAEMREEFRAVRTVSRDEFRSVRGEIATLQRSMMQGLVTMGVGFAGTIATVILTSAT